MKKCKNLTYITVGILAAALLLIVAAIICALVIPDSEIIRDLLLGLGTGLLTSGMVSAFFAIADYCDTENAKKVFNANIDYIVGLTFWYNHQINQVYNNVNQYAMPGGTIVNYHITNIRVDDVTIENQTILMNMLTAGSLPSGNAHENDGEQQTADTVKAEAVQSKIMECFLRVSERAFNRAERAFEKCSNYIARADNPRSQFLEQYRRIKDLGQGFLHPEAQSGELKCAAESFLKSMGKAVAESELSYDDAKAYAEKWKQLFPASAPWIAEQDFIAFPLSSTRETDNK